MTNIQAMIGDVATYIGGTPERMHNYKTVATANTSSRRTHPVSCSAMHCQLSVDHQFTDLFVNFPHFFAYMPSGCKQSLLRLRCGNSANAELLLQSAY